jgi:hypothetical protein
MEGPKSFAEKPQKEESIESLTESIERAQELVVELKEFNDVEVIGDEAMALNSRAEELARELTRVLKNIPAKDCIENELPYHPTDKKPGVNKTPLPDKPDYPHNYDSVSSNSDYPNSYPRSDAEQAA